MRYNTTFKFLGCVDELDLYYETPLDDTLINLEIDEIYNRIVNHLNFSIRHHDMFEMLLTNNIIKNPTFSRLSSEEFFDNSIAEFNFTIDILDENRFDEIKNYIDEHKKPLSIYLAETLTKSDDIYYYLEDDDTGSDIDFNVKFKSAD